MSAFKKLERRDVFTTTHLTSKSWNVSGSSTPTYGVKFYGGVSGSIPSFPINSPSITYSDTFNQLLRYRSIRQLYFTNYETDSYLTTGSFENYLQSSLHHSGSRELSTHVGVVSFPRNTYGVGLKPGSINFSIIDTYIENESNYVLETVEAGGQYIEDGNSGTIVDDGEGRILASSNSLFNVQENEVIGAVIYSHGLVVFTQENFAKYFSNLTTPELSWNSFYPVYTTNYTMKVRDEELNFSLNPTAKKDSFGTIADNISGSEFKPYITTIGLYNDDQELIAVAKLSQPLPKTKDTDMTFVVKLDI
jgi:hypothetical protein